ncbi:Hypothetical protein RG1141_CH01650 [Neorhizobium galegae bv. officinalis bv. officinalis str. HAMBI 1141]|uniref:Uncharacterized protein n=1 Tax=Neorhizobium galegae bv. officinalis bv. officinalis str. HAMBI 1141 TaxID=1028801 RepID=A0A068T5D0_NEOGA|nr:hypothetical protein [Neorhizobium galegae]CDN52530.1 Hypothetical protein RG1141_CH01650 [Neorhizobium galegae bv. officinalis bv. officinalis str. HAMBI 1141]
MPRIRFSSEQIYETGAPGKGPKFPQGFVLDADDVGDVLRVGRADNAFALAFLNRWVQRGKAEYVGEDVATSDPKDVVWAGAKIVEPIPSEPEGADLLADDGLDDMTRAQLDALAADRNVDISSARNKADVIVALRSAASTEIAS